MTELEVDLLPCPCCKSTDVHYHDEFDTYVLCNGCGLCASLSDTRGDPREVWNRREQKVLTDADILCIARKHCAVISSVDTDEDAVFYFGAPELAATIRATLAAMK